MYIYIYIDIERERERDTMPRDPHAYTHAVLIPVFLLFCGVSGHVMSYDSALQDVEEAHRRATYCSMTCAKVEEDYAKAQRIKQEIKAEEQQALDVIHETLR